MGESGKTIYTSMLYNRIQQFGSLGNAILVGYVLESFRVSSNNGLSIQGEHQSFWIHVATCHAPISPEA
jgi:hypothetical protein